MNSEKEKLEHIINILSALKDGKIVLYTNPETGTKTKIDRAVGRR